MRKRLGSQPSVGVGERIQAWFKEHRQLRQRLVKTIRQLRRCKMQLREAWSAIVVKTSIATELRERLSRMRRRVRQLTLRVDDLSGQLELLQAREELWVAWEARERARVDAETARLAADKMRSIDVPIREVE